MTQEQVVSAVFGVVLLGLFIRGLRSTIRIHRIYQHSDDEFPRSPILKQIRDGAAIKVAAAGWFTLLTLRALIALQLPEPLVFATRLISLLLAAAVLDLPTRYERMIERIQRGEYR